LGLGRLPQYTKKGFIRYGSVWFDVVRVCCGSDAILTVAWAKMKWFLIQQIQFSDFRLNNKSEYGVGWCGSLQKGSLLKNSVFALGACPVRMGFFGFEIS